jgi:hypothetical protein
MFALRPSFFYMKSLACHNIVTDEASVLDKTTFTRPPPECERDKKKYYIHWPKDADAQTLGDPLVNQTRVHAYVV